MPIEIFRGRVLFTEELAAIRREIESFDSIEDIDDEMRALIVRNWPDLCRQAAAGAMIDRRRRFHKEDQQNHALCHDRS